MSRVVCVVQSRLGSTRLPGKALLDLGGKKLIRHVVDRALDIKGVHQIVVAVPNAADAIAIDAAIGEADVPVVYYPRIAESDVLSRYAMTATEFRADVIMRATGDCPLLDPEICSRVLKLYRDSGCEYVSNVAPGYVDGEDCECFSVQALWQAHQRAKLPSDREHVTPYIRRHAPDQETLQPDMDRSMLKTSVDDLSDFLRVKELLGA